MSRRGLHYQRGAARYGRRKRCHYCTAVNRALDFTEDHKHPRSRGGTDDALNKVPCCRRCNTLKADMTEAEFAEYVKRYGFTKPADLFSQFGVRYYIVKAKLRISLQQPKEPTDGQDQPDDERLPRAPADEP